MAQQHTENGASSVTVTALTPVRILNLVLPLPHEGTAMHVTDTAGSHQAGLVQFPPLIGRCLRRWGDVDSESKRSPLPNNAWIQHFDDGNQNNNNKNNEGSCPARPQITVFIFKWTGARLSRLSSQQKQLQECLEFEAHLERNLCDLHDELVSGQYSPGRSICFVVTHPKPREVWASGFRDLQWFTTYCATRWRLGSTRALRRTPAHAYRRGTLYGAKRLESHVRSITQNWSVPAHYLKLDLSNFFVSIRKDILRGQLARRITEPWWMRLAETILFQ